MEPEDRSDRHEGAARIVEPAKVANVRPRPDSLLARGKLKASRDRFRLVGVDTFDSWSSDFCIGDFDRLDDAIEEAKARVAKYGSLNRYYVYSDSGELLFSSR